MPGRTGRGGGVGRPMGGLMFTQLRAVSSRRDWEALDAIMFDDPPRRRRRRDRGKELEAVPAAAEDGEPELFTVRIRFSGDRRWLWLWLCVTEYVEQKRHAQAGTRQACDRVAAQLAAREPAARIEVVPL